MSSRWADTLPEGVELEEVECPIGCASGDRQVAVVRDRIAGQPGLYHVVQCRTCGLLRTNPRPTPGSIGAYYPDDYGPYVNGPPRAEGPSALKARLAAILGLGTRRLPITVPGRMLELGCASGDYMRHAQQLGWSVEGIEFSELAAQQARAAGLKVTAGTVESSPGPDEPVDLVVAWMVLEHLHEPLNALTKIRAWLRPGGFLVLSVPDAGALERHLFRSAWYAFHMPAHLYHFSSKTIRKLLRAAGWRVVRVRWQPNPNNLLMSLAYAAEDRGRDKVARAFYALAKSARFSLLRLALGWCLALTRQSGRMEVWAQPLNSEAPPPNEP